MATNSSIKYDVVIPTYNPDRSLLRAVKSALNQTIKPDKIIIVDDGSTLDSSKSLFDEIHKIKTNIPIDIIGQNNSGAASARNKGVQFCSSEIIGFLDSDDAWEEKKMEKQLPLFVNKEIYLVGSLLKGCNKIYNKGDLNKISLHRQILSNHFQTSTICVRKNIFNELQGFPEKQRYAEEGDLYFKLYSKTKYLYQLQEELVLYGDGILAFNPNGLSGNIKLMHRGEIINLRRLRKRKQISDGQYLFYLIYLKLKFLFRYFRRVIFFNFYFTKTTV